MAKKTNLAKFHKNAEKFLKEAQKVESASAVVTQRCNALARLVKFEGFEEGDEPTFNMTEGDGIIMVWHGNEDFIDSVYDMIEKDGCVKREYYTEDFEF